MISKKNFYSTLRVITIIMDVLIACVLVLFGASNLIRPDVLENYLDQNTLICLIMIITGLVAVYSLFRPFSGGILLCICAVILGFVFRGFMRNPITPLVMLIGALSVLSGYLNRHRI